MDDWGWEQLTPWVTKRLELPPGPLFCNIDGQTRGRPWPQTGVRSQLRRLATQAGVRRRFAPHKLRHAHAVEMARESVPLNVIQRQLGHTNLGVTSTYLHGIDNAEIINIIHHRRQPMIPAIPGLMRSPSRDEPTLPLLRGRRSRAREGSRVHAKTAFQGRCRPRLSAEAA